MSENQHQRLVQRSVDEPTPPEVQAAVMALVNPNASIEVQSWATKVAHDWAKRWIPTVTFEMETILGKTSEVAVLDHDVPTGCAGGILFLHPESDEVVFIETDVVYAGANQPGTVYRPGMTGKSAL